MQIVAVVLCALIGVSPVEVRYDEFTQDIELNRLIKAAIVRLGRMRIRSDAARRSLRIFDSALETVHYDPRRLPDTTYTRLNEHYRPAVELAKLILRSSSFELRHGEVRASAFLVDMNKVFENFVVVALRDTLRLTERTLPQGAKEKPLRLDADGRIALKRRTLETAENAGDQGSGCGIARVGRGSEQSSTAQADCLVWIRSFHRNSPSARR